MYYLKCSIQLIDFLGKGRGRTEGGEREMSNELNVNTNKFKLKEKSLKPHFHLVMEKLN